MSKTDDARQKAQANHDYFTIRIKQLEMRIEHARLLNQTEKVKELRRRLGHAERERDKAAKQLK